MTKTTMTMMIQSEVYTYFCKLQWHTVIHILMQSRTHAMENHQKAREMNSKSGMSNQIYLISENTRIHTATVHRCCFAMCFFVDCEKNINRTVDLLRVYLTVMFYISSRHFHVNDQSFLLNTALSNKNKNISFMNSVE